MAGSGHSQGEETVRKHSYTVKTQVHCSSFDETVDEEHNMILLRAHANDVCGYTLKHADDEFFLLIIVSYNHCVFFFLSLTHFYVSVRIGKVCFLHSQSHLAYLKATNKTEFKRLRSILL